VSRRRQPEVVDVGVNLRQRQRILTGLATSSMPFDPPLPPTHPKVIFCKRWARIGGFHNQDEATLARLVEVAERWVVELGLAESLARIERHWRGEEARHEPLGASPGRRRKD
jgi:hypothetical protein